MGTTADDLRSWRKSERDRLIAARENLDAATLERLRQRIDAHLWRSFPGLAAAKLAFCWPIRGEYDARRLAQKLRERGAVTALPVVVAPRQPLVFREWHPGVALASGPLGILYPVGSDPVVPTVALVPMIGWDEAGHRLGYGAGFFDRTLASPVQKPVVIGVSYELARMKTIRPQSWDIPMDWVVSERGTYRRDPEGLVFLGEPVAGEPSALASPVCYAGEIDPGNESVMRPTLANGKVCYVEIPALDINRSADFYAKVFAWRIRQRPDGHIAFDNTTGEVSGTWVVGRKASAEPGLLLYIMVDSVAATLDAVLAHGGALVQPIGADAPEVTARFRDPAGNVIGLYQKPGR